ncbi:hypothetical protein EJ04DRAFT_565033 [Polyplosphaeria fusca]|uniref:Uncharacterized protein n=1 Tax=Polyplosphaeria fusca TaxID=682080 RepID=A0A9P4QYR5_9PLEO|nr:hypothetical protein EJ04DRAFT_565033 [Polyplosphaeria fusca]
MSRLQGEGMAKEIVLAKPGIMACLRRNLIAEPAPVIHLSPRGHLKIQATAAERRARVVPWRLHATMSRNRLGPVDRPAHLETVVPHRSGQMVQQVMCAMAAVAIAGCQMVFRQTFQQGTAADAPANSIGKPLQLLGIAWRYVDQTIGWSRREATDAH